jgi:TRAP-type mannitol/chloroaromatic compound transport system permease large subunit
MDKQVIAVFIPILIFLIPVLAVTFNGLTKLAKAKAEAQGALGGDALERIAELETEMQQVRQQLTETQERLDFAERVLAKPRDRATP